MANPQKENGHTDIANEIIEVMAKTHWSSYEIQIILFILRKTYGWHKKEDWISLSTFTKETGINHSSICKTIKKLLKRKIIEKNGIKIGFNKDYEQWGIVAKSPLAKQTLAKSQIGVVAKSPPTKEIITKERIHEFSFNNNEFNSIKWFNSLRRWKGRRLWGIPLVKKKDGSLWCVRANLKTKKITWTPREEEVKNHKEWLLKVKKK